MINYNLADPIDLYITIFLGIGAILALIGFRLIKVLKIKVLKLIYELIILIPIVYVAERWVWLLEDD